MSFRRRDDGAIAVLVAFFSVIAFGFGAIVVDLGYARSLKARAQDAADSAALAGAAALFEGGTRGEARADAHDNADEVLGSVAPSWTGCVDTSPLPADAVDCVSFDSLTNPRQVRVQVPVPNDEVFFGGIFGYEGVDISASAVASLGPVEFLPGCAICVLGAGPHVLNDVEVTAPDADIAFNGNTSVLNDSTVRAGNPTAGRNVFVDGTATIDPTSTVQPSPVDPAAPVSNPLTPPTDLPSSSLPQTDPCTGGPGIYSGTVPLGSCTLTAGWYVITGDLNADPGAAIVGSGAKFWLQSGASIDLSGALTVDLAVPPGDSLIYADTGDAVTIDLFGPPDAGIEVIDGHINAPGGTIGGGPVDECTIDGRVVVAELDVDDGQCLVSAEDVAASVAPPDPPVLVL